MKRSFYYWPADSIGWSGLALLILWTLPLLAQEAAPIEPPPVQTVTSGSSGSGAATTTAPATEATVTVQTANNGASGTDTTTAPAKEATVTAETSATATTTPATEPAAAADTSKAAPAENKPAAEPAGDTSTDNVAAAVSLPSAQEATGVATNAPEPTVRILGLPVATNSPPRDPRAGDAPGWWFEAALKQGGGYPMFLGVRFADASRAIIIETPVRKLTTGQPLVYRLWVCNDLPQPLECRVGHVIREKETVLVAVPEAAFSVNGSGVRNVSNYTQSTAALAPGQYTVEATLHNQAGNVLHRYTENIEILAKGQ